MNQSEKTTPDKSDTIGNMLGVAGEAAMKTGLLRCPICERRFAPDALDATMPFCSARCKNVDLGRWLDESYGLPYETPEDVESDD